VFLLSAIFLFSASFFNSALHVFYPMFIFFLSCCGGLASDFGALWQTWLLSQPLPATSHNGCAIALRVLLASCLGGFGPGQA
jgi:hypothetical protein